jgi:hypothetical protein
MAPQNDQNFAYNQYANMMQIQQFMIAQQQQQNGNPYIGQQHNHSPPTPQQQPQHQQMQQQHRVNTGATEETPLK